MNLVDYILFLIIVFIIQYIVYELQMKKISINKQLLNVISVQQNIINTKVQKEEVFYKILRNIRGQLGFIFIKECPEEEKTEIPKEICNWIDELLEEKDNAKK